MEAYPRQVDASRGDVPLSGAMDEYHPPPAYGVPYDPSAAFNQPYQSNYTPSTAQGNEASYAMSSTSSYSIPGLQAQPASIHPNFATPLGQFWQQLQDSNLLSLPLTSFPPNAVVPQQPDSNPLATGERADTSLENDYTPDDELPDHNRDLNGGDPEVLNSHDGKDYRARSESGEISDGEEQLLGGVSLDGKREEDNMLHAIAQFSSLKPEHLSGESSFRWKAFWKCLGRTSALCRWLNCLIHPSGTHIALL